jgi:hypothetical protein
MKKNRLVDSFFLFTIILSFSCNNTNFQECDSIPEISTSITNSHPCLSTGIIEITSPVNENYSYKINQGNFQSDPVFKGISVGQHILFVKDNSGCETSKEVVVNTIPEGIEFAEVAAILKTRCVTCHSGVNPHAGLDFLKACDVLNHWDRIQARAVEGNPSPMPSTGLIPIEERNKIMNWINKGHTY